MLGFYSCSVISIRIVNIMNTHINLLEHISHSSHRRDVPSTDVVIEILESGTPRSTITICWVIITAKELRHACDRRGVPMFGFQDCSYI